MLKTMQGLTPTISIIVPDTVDLTEANVYFGSSQAYDRLYSTYNDL